MFLLRLNIINVLIIWTWWMKMLLLYIPMLMDYPVVWKEQYLIVDLWQWLSYLLALWVCQAPMCSSVYSIYHGRSLLHKWTSLFSWGPYDYPGVIPIYNIKWSGLWWLPWQTFVCASIWISGCSRIIHSYINPITYLHQEVKLEKNIWYAKFD